MLRSLLGLGGLAGRSAVGVLDALHFGAALVECGWLFLRGRGGLRALLYYLRFHRFEFQIAAVDAGCDFPGFVLHSFRRANITMRQEEGGSAIEARKIAGHATVSQTGDYTVVQLKRQEELTRAIQGRRAKATAKNPERERRKLAIVEAA